MAKASREESAAAVRDRFDAALAALVEEVKRDRSILAAMLCGSLSHDTVWSYSDIDLLLVTIDDRKADRSDISLYADGVNVHACLMTRAEFRKAVEGSLRSSFIHSYLAKGRLLYTTDDTIAALVERLSALGERDTRLQIMAAATRALPCLYKARKWLITRRDLDYAALWILYAADALARMEVLLAGQLADRETLPRALALNPELFRTVYSELLNAKKTPARVEEALAAAEAYLAAGAKTVFAPVFEHLGEVGEARSATEIEDHFQRNFGVGGVTMACEYLADRGLIGKAALPARLTKRSNVDVNELAFFCGSDAPDAW